MTWVAVGLLPILVATLSPQPEEVRIAQFTIDLPRHAGAWKDVAQNVVLYVPLGLVLSARGVRPGTASAMAAVLSASIEVLQLYLVPGRYPAGLDIITNTAGAQLGALVGASSLGRRFRRWLRLFEQFLVQAVRSDRRAASKLSLLWGLFVSTVLLATGWLLMPAPPPPFFHAVAGPFVDSGTGPLRIGGDEDPTARFSGLIDEVRIYSVARTAQDISTDMTRPIGAKTSDPTLVAAYSFDEGSGTTVTDATGRGHDGTVSSAAWVRQGHFGAALSFDGRTSEVVIPAAPALDFREAMTLEAWVHPVGPPGRWPAVVSRDGGAYYMVTSSEGRPFRPAAGGRFTDVARFVGLWTPIKRGEWTHLATTFDSRAIRLYVNGKLAGARVLWSAHHPHSVELNGTALASGRVADPRRFQTTMLNDFRLGLTLACGERAVRGPVFVIAGVQGVDLLTVQAEGRDVRVNWASRALSLGLPSPSHYISDALNGCETGREARLVLLGPLQNLRIEREGHVLPDSHPGLASAWAFVLRDELMPAWARTALTAIWILMLFVPIGFWMRLDVRGVGAGLLVVVAVMIALRLWRVAPPEASHVLLAVIGYAAGISTRVLTDSWRRVSAAPPS